MPNHGNVGRLGMAGAAVLVAAALIAVVLVTPAGAEPDVTSVTSMSLPAADISSPRSTSDLSCPSPSWCASVLPSRGGADVITQSNGVWAAPVSLKLHSYGDIRSARVGLLCFSRELHGRRK